MTIPDPETIFQPILEPLWLLVKIWWWFLLPLLLYFPAKFFYRWWVHWELWYKEEISWTILEVIPPDEMKKPFRAMEDFFTATFWPVYDSPNWRETWCEGELSNGPFWYSWEVASFEGQIHFYLRIPSFLRRLFESLLHAHYPDVEIIEAEDYTKKAPQDIPNKDVTLYGEDYHLYRQDAYPITTYKFFEIRPEEVEEEKRLDTFAALMEELSKLKKGEQLWFQIIVNPILDSDQPWAKEGQRLKEELARRVKLSGKTPSITGEAYRLLAYNKMPFEQPVEEEQGLIAPELRLTPGEKEVLSAVESKIAKLGFRSTVRALYIAENDAFYSPNGKIIRAYFSHFASQNLNTIAFYGKTRTKIHYFFRKRRLYGRKRDIFRRYIHRWPPLFPNRQKGTMVLNAEELATIFHLPAKAAFLPPGVPRVAAKKGVPPSNIPLEEE